MRPLRPCVLSGLVAFAAVVLAPTQTAAQLGGLALPPLPDLTNPFGTVAPTPAPTVKPTARPTVKPTLKPATTPAPTKIGAAPAPSKASPAPAPSKAPTAAGGEESSSDDDEEDPAGTGTGTGTNGTEGRVKSPRRTFAPTPVYLVPGNSTEEDSGENDETLQWAPVVYAAIATGLAVVLLLTAGLVVRMIRNPVMASPVLEQSPLEGSPSTGASPSTITTSATRTMRTGSRGRVSFMSPLAEQQAAVAAASVRIVGSSSEFDDCVSSVGQLSASRRNGGGVLLGEEEDAALADSVSRLEKAEATVVSLADDDDEEAGGATAAMAQTGAGPNGVTGWKWGDGSMSFTTTFRDLFRANTGEVLGGATGPGGATLSAVPEAAHEPVIYEQASPLVTSTSSFAPPTSARGGGGGSTMPRPSSTRASPRPPVDATQSLLMTMHLDDVLAPQQPSVTAAEVGGGKSMSINLTDTREGTMEVEGALLGGAEEGGRAVTMPSANLIDLTSTAEQMEQQRMA